MLSSYKGMVFAYLGLAGSMNQSLYCSFIKGIPERLERPHGLTDVLLNFSLGLLHASLCVRTDDCSYFERSLDLERLSASIYYAQDLGRVRRTYRFGNFVEFLMLSSGTCLIIVPLSLL